MPTSRTSARPPLWRAVLCVGLSASVTATAGCRTFRYSKGSDESIATARQLSLQGIAARGQGRWDQAEMLFAQAVEQCPRDERARCDYADSLWLRGEQELAVANMEEGVRLSGHDPGRVVQLGNMYLVRGDFSRAAAQADRAIRANRNLASAWALRGKVLEAQNSRTEALASFHRALTLQPNYQEVQLALAELYREQGRPQLALAALQNLADSLPADRVPVEALVEQGLALRQLGRHRDAAQSLAQAAQRGNPPVDLLYELGRSEMDAGDAAAARLAINAALAREPSHPGCLALLDQLATSQGTMATVLR